MCRHQLPHVNVFKHFGVDANKNSKKEGCVEPVMDKIIGKRVFRIVGEIARAITPGRAMATR